MNITVENVWMDFIFTGHKCENINEDWTNADEYYIEYTFPCLPMKGDIIDFTNILNDEAIIDLKEDYKTTYFIVVKRIFKQSTPGDPPRVHFIIKPNI